VSSGGVEEYRVGPLEHGRPAEGATLERLTKPGDVPFSKRPTEPGADLLLAEPLVNRTLRTLGPLLLHAFGPIFPQLDGYTGSNGSLVSVLRNDALASRGERSDTLKLLWAPPPPQKIEAFWLHPLPLSARLNTSSPNSADWAVLTLHFCGQGPFASAEALHDAYGRGELRVCPFRKDTGEWDVPQRTTKASPKGRHPLESHGGVRWGQWSFTVTQRPSTGLALLDVRFRGERVLYELSMQDAQAAYSGTRDSQFFYSDAAFTLSMLSASLEPGVDCPEGAHYLAVPNWYRMLPGGAAETDPRTAKDFWPVCIFRWEEDHTLWRHMQNSAPPEVHGLTRQTIVVRSIATVGNYDYLTDVKLREDGEIEVHTRFAGFIESRYFDPASNPGEANFSTIIRPDLAGPVHSHAVSWKADIDVAGARANALRVTRVRAEPVAAGLAEPAGASPLISKYLELQDVEREGVGLSTFVADPRHPGQWVVVDRGARSAAGNPRGYAVTLGTWSTTQVLPDDHPFTRAMPFTKYQLAVTKYHDEEYRVNSPYTQYDGRETTRGAQDLDRFLADGEGLLDEDVVAWIGLGKEHIVRQEDLPLVSNFGVGFSLQPWNFFERNVAASPPF